MMYLETVNRGTDRLTILVKDRKVAFLRGEPGRLVLEALYDQGRNAFVFINHRDRLYTVISREWAKEMRKRTEETSRRMADDMKKQAATMPPDLRPYYLQAQTFVPYLSMFSQTATAPGAGQPRQYVAGTDMRKVGSYRCRAGELRQAGKKLMDLCLAAPGELSLPAADAETLLAMRADAHELYKLGAFLFGFTPHGPARVGPEAPGLALQFKDNANHGAATSLEAVEIADINADAFGVPSEYLQAVIPLPGPFE